MSKKRDDINLDDDFGLDNFGDDGEGGWEGPEAGTGGKRKPVTSLKGSFVDGVKEGVKDPDVQMKFLRSALPTGYNQTLDFADKVHSGVSDIYREAAKDAEPVLKDLKKLTRKQLLPSLGDKLPKSWAAKLETWSAEEETRGREEIDPEENEISMQLGTLFQAQQEIIQKAEENRIEREQQKEVREVASDKVLQTQTDASMKTLAQIQMNTGRLANYQDQVTINFQRKSLELQYRTYFVNRKLLDTMEQHLELTKSSMETLVHNSGLPDLLKSHNHEKMVEVMRLKYLGEVTDPMSKWFADIGTKLITKGKRDIKEFFQSFGATLSDAVTGIDTLEEQNQMRRDMGEEEQTAGQMGASMLGSMAAEKGAEFGGGLLKKAEWFRKSKLGQFLEKSGIRAQTFFQNMPFEYQRKLVEGRDDPGMFGKAIRWAGEGSGTYKRDDKVIGNTTEELDKRMYWTLQNSRTLNDVIPGWMSKIHEAIIDGNHMSKAGLSDKQQKLATSYGSSGSAQHYSFETNRFETEANIAKRIAKSYNNEDESKNIAESLNNVINAIDPEFHLSEEVVKGLRKYLMNMARNKHMSPIGELWKWVSEAGDNFPRELRGDTTGRPRDDDYDSSNQAHGSWVAPISQVVKDTFGYDDKTEWKDDHPVLQITKYRSIFKREAALYKLSTRWAEFYRRVSSSKDKLIEFARGGHGNLEVMRKQGYLSREQEEYEDSTGTKRKRDKIDSFDWNENTDRLDKDIVDSRHADPESRAEQAYDRQLAAYNREKEKYDELLAAGALPPNTQMPVEPPKPPHMRARGGIIPNDNRHFNKGGEKQKEGFWTTRGASNAKERAGHVVGAGTGTSDEIPSYLSSGEYVVRAKAVRRPGVMSLLRYINSLDDDDGGIFGSSGVGEQDNFALNESIISGNDKLEVQLLAANEKLQKLVDKPYIAMNFGDLTGPDLEKFKEMFGQLRTGGMSFADEAALRGKDAISKGVSWAWDKATWGAKKSWDISTGTVKGAWGIAKKGYAGGKKIIQDWFEDARDILVKGSTEVKIRAEDIRNRVLLDVNTNKVIEKLKDITGEVRRLDTDEIVLRVEDFRRGLTDDKFKPALEWISKKFTQVKNIALAPFRAIRSTFNHVMQIIDMPDDIYVKGDTPWEPRLRVHLFRAGKYSDAKTGKTILLVSDIKGAVMQDMGIDRQPIMVITDDEFNEGKLVGVDGEPVRGLRDKLYSGIKKAGRVIGDLAKKGLGMVKDMGSWIWEKLGLGWDGIKSWFDGTGAIQIGLFTTQTATVTRLEQIWMLLNNRLPGEKETKPEDFGKMAALRIPNLSGHLQSTEEWFNKKRANAELKVMIAREKLNNKIALMEAKRQDKAAKLRARYEEKGEKVPFWVRMFGANKEQFKDEIKSAGKSAIDGAKKARDGIDKPMTFNQYLDWVANLLESKGLEFDLDDEANVAAARKDYVEYRAAFDKKTKMQKIRSNAWTFGSMAKNIASKWAKGQIQDIGSTMSDMADDVRPAEFSEWLDKEWNMSMQEFNALPMHSSDSSHSKTSLRDAWADYHHKFMMRLQKVRGAKDTLSNKIGSAKNLLGRPKDFVGPVQPISDKLSTYLGNKATNLREYLDKAKPMTFEEWLAQTPTGLATYTSLGNSDKAELEAQYKAYCIKFEKDREAQLGAMQAKSVKSIANLYNYFTKNKDLTIDQYMDNIGIGASEYKRMSTAGEERAIALKADYDAYMRGEVKAIARYNRLAAMQTAKSTAAKAKSLKDKAMSARARASSMWSDRANIRDKAKGMMSGLWGKGKSLLESDEDRYNRWQETMAMHSDSRMPVRQISFDNYLDGLGLSEQEFNYLSDDEKQKIIADHAKHNRGGITDIPEAPKTKLFGRTRENLTNAKSKIGGFFGGLRDKAKAVLTKKSSADMDGDGDRDGSAEDQKQKREEAEEKSFRQRMAESFGKGSSMGEGLRGKMKGGMMDIMQRFMNPAGLVKWGVTFATTIAGIFGGLGKGIGAVYTVAKAIAKLPLGGILKAAGSMIGNAAVVGARVLGGGLGMLKTAAMVGGRLMMGGLSILTNPVVLAVGATAFAGYKAYQAVKRSMQDNDIIFRFRMAQYGFKADDEVNVGKILQMESVLKGIVRPGADGVAVMGEGIKAEQLLAIWGIDQEKPEEVTRWVTWFAGRFKPVYLSHVTMNYALLKNADLTKADTLNAADSLKYIKAVHFAGDGKRPYDIMASPEAGGDTVSFQGSSYISRSVDNEYDAAVEWCETHKEEMDLENKAQTDPKAAQKLRDKKENTWRAKTEAAWDVTKTVAGSPVQSIMDAGKYWANKDDMSAWNPLKYVKLGAESLAQGSIDASKRAYEAKASSASVEKKQMMLYQAYIKAGLTPEQAKAVVAEIGRENDYTDKYWYGEHIDPAGNIRNIGPLSWNGDRRLALIAHMKSKGLLESDGGPGGKDPVRFKAGQESLNAMAEFSKNEIFGMKRFAPTANAFRNNPNMSAEDLSTVVGKNYVVWAYGQNTLKNGKAFDWVGADSKRRRYLNSLNRMLQSPAAEEKDVKSSALAGKAAPAAAHEATNAKVASTGAAAPKTAASSALDKTKTVASGAPAPSDSGESVIKSTQPNTATIAKKAVAAGKTTPMYEDTGESTVSTKAANDEPVVMAVSSPAPAGRTLANDDSGGEIPVDIMAQKAKEQQAAAALMAEKRRQDALDSTSTGMDAAVTLMKEQLRVMTSMDSNLAKIERHMAAMVKSAGSTSSSTQQRQTPSSPPNLKVVQNSPAVEPSRSPVSMGRAS